MIAIQQQEKMFLAIGGVLPRKMSLYAIGGTALMLRGLKAQTLDIDLVFDKQENRKEFMRALKKLGAKESDVTLVYGLKNNTPEMLTWAECRFDLFMRRVITSLFSDTMKERADQIHEFGNLIVRAASPSDILLMKSATSREKDAEDIIAIIDKNQIDWKALVSEAEEQVGLGNETAIMSLGEKLEKLANQGTVRVPQEVLNALWKRLTKQVRDKAKRRKSP